MYGRGKYAKPKNNPVQSPVDPTIPTFLCSKCKRLVTVDKIHFVADLGEYQLKQIYNKPVGHYKLCSTCGILLQTWIKGN